MALELFLAIAGSYAAESAPANGAMRAPIWRGVTEVALACDAGSTAGLPPSFCEAALAETRRGSPYPVRLADGSGGIATFILRLTARTRDGRAVLTVAGERAASIDEAQGALLPRSTPAVPGEATERTLARALDAALPWRRTSRIPSPHRQH